MIYFKKNKTTVKWIFSKGAYFNVGAFALFRINQNNQNACLSLEKFQKVTFE